jgi:hypothetical protein
LRNRVGVGLGRFQPEELEVSSRRFNAILLPLGLLLGFAGIWSLQRNIDVQFSALHEERDDLLIRSGLTLKLMSLEYDPLLADIYWTRVIQYYGRKHAQQNADVQLLWPLLDISTTLDPHLMIAYRFGYLFLSEPPPFGAGRTDLAEQLLQRGIRENPDEWRLYEDLGFLYYYNLKDYAKSSAAFLEGSKNPSAQLFMKVLAAKILEQGDNRETSAFLWQEIYNSAKNEDIRKNAMTHLQLLRADADCEQLDLLAAEYRKRTGRAPDSLRDLINAGLLQGIPVDPLGVRYIFNTDGKAQLNPESKLFKDSGLYEKPL